MADLGWKDDAACRGDHGVHWFGRPTPAMVELCAGCPVANACVLEALDQDYRVDVGFWGGTDEYQRRAIRKGLVTIDQARADARRALEVADA